MSVLLELEIKRAFRDWRFIVFTIGMPMMIYLSSARNKTATLGGTSAAKYLLVSMAVFSAIGAALNAGGPRIAAEREIGWTRQLRLTSMSSGKYIAAKVLTGATVSLTATVAIFAFGGFFNGVRMSGPSWVGATLAVWFGSLVFCSLSVLLGYMFTSTSITVGLMVVNLGFSMAGGLFWPVETFPSWLRVVAKLTPTYHLAQLGHYAQRGEWPSVVDLVVLGGYLALFSALAAWLYRRDEIRV
ncbi:ABC-2 type transport system permease protein [Streptomyces misionensis]|uniref:ABC-2 type transport system permease protein n=1 Tax=Streptomyces misionensis TaxID=67331 RepID=A0A1H4IA70_9ACTN|nr:ABC transporter permease [Streptomyces misionensis]SEB30994.1 ABC-2 type transport system permease protein [Streptomyces misionensis]